MSHFLTPLLRATGAVPMLVNASTGRIVASHVEAPADSRGRRRGLLGRDNLPEGHALVLAPCGAVHTCFMRFPIDVAFTTRDGLVLKVVPRVPAWRIATAVRAFATVELPAGTLERAGIVAGCRLALV